MPSNFIRRGLTLALATAAASTFAIAGIAAPASANYCPLSPDPTDPVFANPCADAYESDSDPNTPGTTIYVAASLSVGAYGSDRICTGYYGVGGQYGVTPVTVEPEVSTETNPFPHAC